MPDAALQAFEPVTAAALRADRARALRLAELACSAQPEFYKRLATAKTPEHIDALLEEIVDRFGKLPPQAQTLIDVHRLRVLAKPYGVIKVDAAPGAGPFEQRLRAAYADGQLDAETFRSLLEAHRREQEDRHETRSR